MCLFPSSVELIMVQLSPSPTMDITPPLERLEEGRKRQEDPVTAGSPKVGSPTGLSALQLSLEVSTAYHGYETYIEDGLICLKHKVRNLEKKKLKLEDYKKRLNQGEALNKDQMVRPVMETKLGPQKSGWSDSSQVSSPDREGAFTIVDSGHGDSLSVSTVEVPLTPHGHHHTALLPMQVYPLSQPLRVAFTASRTANFAPGNLDQPIVFDQLHSNLGEMYDTHIGRFTCPVNGTYVFIFHILKLAINVPLYINLMRNEDVMVSAYANDGAPDHETASNHAILPLFQGDQVWLRLHRGAIYGSTWKYSTFSGFLLYQD
uniref:C1q domain-containing protein n=1 Tax=Seriola lalandi dorsalis TaxID=1841481 RepID=A0A3B4XGK7_SERLL